MNFFYLMHCTHKLQYMCLITLNAFYMCWHLCSSWQLLSSFVFACICLGPLDSLFLFFHTLHRFSLLLGSVSSEYLWAVGGVMISCLFMLLVSLLSDRRADAATSSSVPLSGHQCDPHDISSAVTKGFLLLPWCRLPGLVKGEEAALW